MTSVPEPPRLLAAETQLPHELRQALEAGREVAPSRAQLADLSQRLAPLLSPAGLSAPPQTPSGIEAAAHTAPHLGLSKGVLAMVAVAVTAPAALYGVAHHLRTQGEGQDAAPAAFEERPAKRTTGPALRSKRQSSAMKRPSAPLAETASPEPPASGVQEIQNDRPKGAVERVIQPSVEPAVEPADKLARVAKSSQADGEFRLIQKARRQLSMAPRKALELAREHSRRFENGLFVQERETIAIEALVSIGDMQRARRRAETFAERFPHSAYLRRIRILLQ